MEDEASFLLDGKTLGNLRVVDLKQELEKRGLSKSGSKKDLVKRLKVQLEFEKLCGERKSAADCDLKLDLDADTEQNEFVQQYLAQQQKIYAEQKEVKRRIELEETLKSTEEKEVCDSTKCDEEATIDDDDQTEPDEPEEEDSRADSYKAVEDAKTYITNPETEADSSEIQASVDQNTSQPPETERESAEVQDDSDQVSPQPSKAETESSIVQDDSDLEISQLSTVKTRTLQVQDEPDQEKMPSELETGNLKVQDDTDHSSSEPSKVKRKSPKVQEDTDRETFQLSKEGGDVDEETSELLNVQPASSDICQETSQSPKVDAANTGVQYDADVQETFQISNVLFPEEKLVKDATATANEYSKNQIISSTNVDSSTEIAESFDVIDNVENLTNSSEITESACTISSTENTENHDTTDHQAEQSSSSEIIQDKHVESSIENTQEISHQNASSEVKNTHPDSRALASEKLEPLLEMEPATQFSTVPYSLMDIQLPESPGNVKSKSTSDSFESDSVNNTEETHSNGIDSTDIKGNKSSSEKTDSKGVPSEKVCIPDNSNVEKSDELIQRSKESNSDTSKELESGSQSKKESDYKGSRSKEHTGDRKTVKSNDDFLTYRESRSKSRERKRTRRSSEDSHKHSKSRSRERVLKSKEESCSRRESRSRSKEKDRKTLRHEKGSDTCRASCSRRDSHSRSKESEQKTHESSTDSKSRKAVHGRKSRSTSNDSKSECSSDSVEDLQKKKNKPRKIEQKQKEQEISSDTDSDSSSSSSSSSSTSTSSSSSSSFGFEVDPDREPEIIFPYRPKNLPRSGSSSPTEKTLVIKSIKSEDPSELPITISFIRPTNRNYDQNSRSKNRGSGRIQRKSKTKSAEKSDKQKERNHKTDISDSVKVPKSPSREDSSIKKKSKYHSSEPQMFPIVESKKIREHKRKSSDDEDSKSRSRESSPANKSSKSKIFEQDPDSANFIKSSKAKRHESSDGSRSRSREKGSENKIETKSELPADIKKKFMSQAEYKRSSKSRSRSREHSPIECKPNDPLDDSTVSFNRGRQEKQPEGGSSDDNQTSRSRSQESTLVKTAKVSTGESSVDSASLTKHAKQKSQGFMDGRNSRSRSREKSPDLKKSKISFDNQDCDSLNVSKCRTEPAETDVSEGDIPGVVKKGNITIFKKEPVKQKLRIKRDNVISSQSKKEKKETKSDKLESSESNEENQKEPASAAVHTSYVSRKITLSSRSQSVTSDEPKSKRSKWGNMASQKTSTTINISTNSLKNWFPDFKLLKDPTPEDSTSLIKEESDIETSVNKPEEESMQVLGTKRFQEAQREMQMEVETGPVSKILFIQNLVRPFTLNQLKDLLRETGNFIEEDFWIDKIKSKCFVTYETEEEAIKTRSHLNGARWPSSNPKILSVEFSNEEELTLHRSGNDASKPVLQPVSESNETQESRSSHSVDEFRKKDHDQDRKRERSKLQPPVREWDKDKVTQESPDRERSGKDADKSKYMDKKEKKDSKRRPNEDTPAKLLDDLFQKTKSSPCIYWLPLTDEQVQERLEGKRVRRLEREKQNKQREREDAENKSKRPRSRNRTREADTRRSSTRSRSPATRRR